MKSGRGVAIASVVGVVVFGACVEGVRGQIGLGDLTVDLELVADGLTAPVYATHAGDGSGRLFVVDQVGFIRVVDANGNLLATPFLDLTGLIVTVNPGFDERGALGLAFHPEYESNGRFFVRYSAPRDGGVDEPCFGTSRGCHKEVLAEFGVSGDPNVANPTPTVLFEIDEPQFNHNSGNVAFGPDGFLYFTLGDGGGAHDGLADMPVSHGPIGNGQNIETVLGGVLRIDVDGGSPYAIPADNPFVGVTGADELYAYGMRNPYRFSFDDGPGGDGRLIVADVGQNLFEEINVVEKGGNYGWVIREGLHCFDPFNPTTPPAMCATTGPHGEPLLDPVAEYDHGDGIAVVGGFVYRGSAIPGLVGRYVFGDFSRTFFPPDGRLFWLDAEGDLSQIFEMRRFGTMDPLGRYVLGFGEDEDGELYLLTSGNLGPEGTTGRVEKIVAPPLEVSLDIRPGSCPNPLNRRSRGVVPMGLSGNEGFDAGAVDPGSLSVSRADGVGGSVPALDGPPGPHVVVADVSSEFGGEACACEEGGPDGLADVSMKFSTEALVSVLELGGLAAGSEVELVLSGALLDGEAFSASDCVLLVPPGDVNADGVTNVFDFGILARNFGGVVVPDEGGDLTGDGVVDVFDFGVFVEGFGL